MRKDMTEDIIRGVCGWFDGQNVDSCVMIRFIEKRRPTLFQKRRRYNAHE